MKSDTLSAAIGGALCGALLTWAGISYWTAPVSEQKATAVRPFQRPAIPRIAPIDPADFTPEQRAALPGGNGNANMRTVVREPELARRWYAWSTYLWDSTSRGDSAIPPREKQLVILRVNWLCHDDWMWGRHAPRAKGLGWTSEDIARIPKGPDAPGWTEWDRTLLQAVEEMHTDYFISDATWARLAAHYNVRQMLDFVLTVGQYHLNGMYLNSVGAPKEPGEPSMPNAG